MVHACVAIFGSEKPGVLTTKSWIRSGCAPRNSPNLRASPLAALAPVGRPWFAERIVLQDHARTLVHNLQVDFSSIRRGLPSGPVLAHNLGTGASSPEKRP